MTRPSFDGAAELGVLFPTLDSFTLERLLAENDFDLEKAAAAAAGAADEKADAELAASVIFADSAIVEEEDGGNSHRTTTTGSKPQSFSFFSMAGQLMSNLEGPPAIEESGDMDDGPVIGMHAAPAWPPLQEPVFDAMCAKQWSALPRYPHASSLKSGKQKIVAEGTTPAAAADFELTQTSSSDDDDDSFSFDEDDRGLLLGLEQKVPPTAPHGPAETQPTGGSLATLGRAKIHARSS